MLDQGADLGIAALGPAVDALVYQRLGGLQPLVEAELVGNFDADAMGAVVTGEGDVAALASYFYP